MPKYCLLCSKIVQSERNKASAKRCANRDPASFKKRVAEWREKNPDRVAKYRRKFVESNIDQIRIQAAANARNKRLTDPRFALNGRISTQISMALKSKKGGRPWEKLVGYTVDDLFVHIEKQFVKGMGWHNRSDWHIDHIRPISSFKFESAEDPAFKECWALHNLRPLWTAKNLTKGASREFLL